VGLDRQSFLQLALVPAALVGYTASCACSPVAAVRKLVRPLFAWRLPWDRYAFALLTFPALAVLVVITSHLLSAHAGSDGSASGAVVVRQWLRIAIADALVAAPFIVGWCGFAARRLLARFSPLAVGLLLGALLVAADWLPDLLRPPVAVATTSILGALATSIVAVWLYQRSRGSLLPVLLLRATNTTLIVGALAGTGFGQGFGRYEVFTAAECAVAIGLVLGWQMWRGPERLIPDAAEACA
jgi:hypothetical protein